MYVRTRLAVAFVLIVAAVLGIFSWFVFESTREGVLSELTTDVRTRAQAIADSVAKRSAGDRFGRVGLDTFVIPDTYMQVVTTDGRVVEKSGNLKGTLPFLPEVFVRGGVVERQVDGIPLLLSGARIRTESTTRGYAIVARSPGPMYQLLHRLRGVLLPGAVAVLAVTGLVVWLMVRRSLGPLVRLSEAAAKIASHKDHEGRVGGGDRPDEIGQLAAAIDRMLESLEESHNQARQANEAQRKFLADVSHELRAPLTITLSSLDLLARVGDSDPAFRDRVVSEMRTEVARMARMVSDLLVMARTGKTSDAADRPLLLGEVLNDLCRRWSLRAGAVDFTWHLNGTDDAVVHANEDYLRQLMSILLDNAFKFTSPGGKVEVRVDHVDGRAEIVVVDTGVGIAEADLPRVFDRFYRGVEGRSHEGTGLGLSIAKHIAERYGGAIDAESRAGVGSRFTVTLPLVN